MRRAVTGLLMLVAMGALTSSSDAQDRDRPRIRPEAHPRDRDRAQAIQDTGSQAGNPGNQDQLARAAAGISEAWLSHDAGTIVAGSPQLVIQLPGADPSAALGPRQAAALLSDFFAAAREVDIKVRSAKEVEPGRGFVELLRQYRVNGTQDIRAQSLFLGYRRQRQAWILVELRAIEP